MANAEHLSKLKEGAKAWNRWRKEYPEIRPNLSGTNLARADLGGFNLRGVNLWEANLSRAKLVGTDLSSAYLSAVTFDKANLAKSNLSNTNLFLSGFRGADLRNANLSGAKTAVTDLSEADLQGAILDDADLSGKTLGENINVVDLVSGESSKVQGSVFPAESNIFPQGSGADLTNATFGSTRLFRVDLSTTRGLHTIKHFESSYIDISTLLLTASATSSSRAYEVCTFLKAAGVTQEQVSMFMGWIGRNLREIIEIVNPAFSSCFISYSHKDKSFIDLLYDELIARGISCWLDEKQLVPGERIHDAVYRAILSHEKLILCCSQSSLNSSWVDDEIAAVIEKERKEMRDILIPLIIDDYLFEQWSSGWGPRIRQRLTADFRDWPTNKAKFQEQLEKVLKALQLEKTSPPSAPPAPTSLWKKFLKASRLKLMCS